MEAGVPRVNFTVGGWLVEPTLDRLSRGPTVHRLRPRLADLLVYLAEHAGEVVSKDQILEDVWRRRFVAESVLSRSVAELRQLLGDSAGNPRFIETIPKRGYRLVAPVSRTRPTTAESSRARPSIAVLPLVDMASSRDQEYFCDGLAEELTNSLANVPGLRVAARTSAFAFKGRVVDVREIGRVLQVGCVLEGGVQRSGDRVRVTVQLVDVSDGCHLWSERFDRPAGDIFALEDEIARAVTAALRVRLLDGSGGGPLRRTRTTAPEAYDLYLRGRYHSAQRSADHLQEAARRFEAAIAIDPGYAAAHASLAECYAVCGFVGHQPPHDVFPRARAAAERALALVPDLADAHAVLGHVSGMYDWRWEDAEASFERALALNPACAMARVWYSHLLAALGRVEQGVEETERASECDPLSPTVQTTLGLALYHAGRYERAIDRYLRVLEVNPSFALARLHLGRAYAACGNPRRAADEFQKIEQPVPLALAFLASAWRRLGRKDRAKQAVLELDRMARARYVGPLARSCAHLGDNRTQLAWLTRAFDEHEGPVPLLNTDPAMNHLRSEPAFLALLDRLRLPRVRVP